MKRLIIQETGNPRVRARVRDSAGTHQGRPGVATAAMTALLLAAGCTEHPSDEPVTRLGPPAASAAEPLVKTAPSEEADRSRIAGVGRQIGMHAPEIEGEDIDGNLFKLSDYRGQVVVLDFWGHWLTPSRAMYPLERSLVKRLSDKPFALIGVNCDSDRDALKRVLQQEQITWRSFWNGGSAHGPISTAWNVRGWPTTYVLDHNGIIRFRDLRGHKLEQAVDRLLAEMGRGD